MSDYPSSQSDRVEQCFDFKATGALPSILETPLLEGKNFFGYNLLAPYTLTAIKTIDGIF